MATRKTKASKVRPAADVRVRREADGRAADEAARRGKIIVRKPKSR